MCQLQEHARPDHQTESKETCIYKFVSAAAGYCRDLQHRCVIIVVVEDRQVCSQLSDAPRTSSMPRPH